VSVSYGGDGTRTVLETLTIPQLTPTGTPGTAVFLNGVQTSFTAPT
jgi:hypothetical protein